MFINVPTAYIGANVGFTKSNDKPVCRVSLIQRPIPAQPWYLNLGFATGFGSLVIFTTMMSEFHFVFTSVWRSYMVGAFMFSFVNLQLLLLVTSLISILFTYLNLRAGNWKWWWPSFFMGMSTGMWLFIYCMYMMYASF